MDLHGLTPSFPTRRSSDLQKRGLVTLPAGVTRRTVFGLAMTAGVGFTVALFIAGLAYDPGSLTTDSAKIGILAGSLIAGILGYGFLRAGPELDDQIGRAHV